MKMLKKCSVVIALLLIILIVFIFIFQKNAKEDVVLQQLISESSSSPEERPTEGKTIQKASNLELKNVAKNSNCLDVEELLEYNNALNIVSDEFNEYLLNSDNTEAQIMAAITGSIEFIITQDSNEADEKAFKAKRIENLSKAYQTHPNNQLVAYHLMGICTTAPDNKYCSQNVIDKVAKTEGSNGAIWAHIAAINAKKGNESAAIEALEQLDMAPVFDDFRMLRLRTFTATIQQTGIIYDQAAEIAMGYEAAMAYYGISELMNFCTAIDINRADIVQVCQQYGTRLYDSGSSYISKFIGLGIQKNVFNVLFDEQSLKKIEQNNTQLRKHMMDNMSSDLSLYKNKEFLNYAISILHNNDEVKSSEILKKEANHIRNSPLYVQCPVEQ
jgi:hypothetical protein